jgi:glycosyltransferase involved in cell wall biosynthesis
MYKITIIDHVGAKAGMDYYSSSLARGFINNNCKCTIYSNFTGIDSNKINYKNYFDGHSNSNLLIKLLNFIKAMFKSSYEAKKEKNDLVILHLFAANFITLIMIIIPKLFGLKIAIIAHDIESFVNNDNNIYQHLIYNLLSTHIIVHNKYSYDTLINNIEIKNITKIKIIKHGGYLDHIEKKYTQEEYRKQLNLDINGKYILFFGQIKNVKGLDILLEALSDVPEDIKLIIAGKPWKSDFSKYEELINKYQLSNRIIRKIQFIEDDEREKLFFASDVNVLPYRVIYQSGVLLMAMSHGLPVIASDLEPNKEVIEDGINGFLFKTENSKELSEKILKFFNQKSTLEKIQTNSFNTIKNEYNWDNIANEYIKIL